ncbi:hypothetical protein B6I80_08990 [Klebsiella pneumoniae]|nr:hypothetical protein B6I80_08990 [Klebsiella pneumoniae]HBX4175752.1 hypothetical protein [Klebsiella pneumoniae]
MQAARGRTGLLFSIRLQVDICLVPQTVPQLTAVQHYGLIQQMDSWYQLSGDLVPVLLKCRQAFLMATGFLLLWL